MKLNAKKMGLMAFLAAGSVMASESFAGTLDLTYNGVDPGQSLVLSHTGTTSEPASTSAGVFNWTQNSYKNVSEGGVGPRSWENTVGIKIDTFCIEITQGLGTSYETSEDIASAPIPGLPDGPMGVMNAHYLSQLWSNVFTANDFNVTTNLFQFNAGGAVSTVQVGSSPSDAQVKAAAVQLAIWEIVNDSGLDLTAGAFTGGGNNLAVRNLAQSYLDALNEEHFSTDWLLVVLKKSNAQDQVTAVRLGSTSTIPGVPSPVAVGIGLVGFMMLGLRRQREMV